MVEWSALSMIDTKFIQLHFKFLGASLTQIFIYGLHHLHHSPDPNHLCIFIITIYSQNILNGSWNLDEKEHAKCGEIGWFKHATLIYSCMELLPVTSLRILHFSLPLPAPRWFCQIVQPRGYTRTPTGALRYFFPCAIVICAAVECDRVGDKQADGQMTQFLSRELTEMRNLHLCYCSKIICSWNCGGALIC